MTTVIAIANQKGGVGKTTVALNLATALADPDLVGKRVLLIDLDAQANSTVGLKQRPQPGVANWLLFDEPLEKVVVDAAENLDLVPSDSSTMDVENALTIKARVDTGRAFRTIKARLDRIDRYDYIIIDCPPSLGMITHVGLYAANFVLTPVDCGFFALQGLVTLSGVIRAVQEQHSRVRLLAVIPNKYRHVEVHKLNVARLKRKFGLARVWRIIPETTQIEKAQEAGESIWRCEHVDRRHRAIWAELVREVLRYG